MGADLTGAVPPLLLLVSHARADLGLSQAAPGTFRVADARTPPDAVALVNDLRPDLVIIDADLPDGQGFTLCRTLHDLDGDLTLVMAVQEGHQLMIERAYESGAFGFESKPLDWAKGADRLAQSLRVSRALRRWQTEAVRLEQTQRIARLPAWHYHPATGMMHCSTELRRLCGLPEDADAVPFETYMACIHPEDRDRVRAALEAAVAQRSGMSNAFRLQLPDGTIRYVDEQAEVIPGESGRGTEFVGAVRDVTEWMGSNDRIHALANYDTVTRLPNRSLFLDRLNQALSQARRSKWRLGVLMLDMDHFRDLNLTFGHSAGDTALREVAGRLKAIARTNDTLARMAGDEFCFLLVDLKSPENAATVAEKIMVALSEPVKLVGRDVPIGASVGITVFPDDAEGAEDLMRNVESAVSSSKSAGRGVYRFYRPEVNERASERLTLMANLRGALERGEFMLHYHPLVNVEHGTPMGMEALLRWNHPRQGLLSPDRFIGILEETGLIVSVGEWALRHSVNELRALKFAQPLRLCVNLSTRQFQHPGLVDAVASVIREVGIDPSLLDLEITESLLMQDIEAAIEKLHALRDLGVMLSIDDFGTGFSSLSYLSRFPLTTLKIDKSFVQHVLDRPNDQAIAKSIIALARSLKLRIVVEGVENTRQLEFFRAYGCDEVQGYLFAQPMDVEELGRWLQRGPVAVQ